MANPGAESMKNDGGEWGRILPHDCLQNTVIASFYPYLGVPDWVVCFPCHRCVDPAKYMIYICNMYKNLLRSMPAYFAERARWGRNSPPVSPAKTPPFPARNEVVIRCQR